MSAINEAAQTYSEGSITVLKGLEPVKQRPGMYTLTDSPLHIIQEVIDNSSDEVLAEYGTKIIFTEYADGSISVEDDGRGIPVGLHPQEKTPVVELVFTRLHAGGKFNKKEGGAYSFSGGLHGVGVSVTNALSNRLEVTVWRDGLESTIAFENGFVKEELKSIKSPRPKRATGTRVRCWPNPKYFDSPKIPRAQLIRLLRSKAVLLPGCEVIYINEAEDIRQTWKYTGGLKEYLLDQVSGKSIVTPFEAKGYATEEDEMFPEGEGAAWVVTWTEEGNLERESYVNLIPTPLGGTHEAGLRDGIYQAVRSFMETHGLGAKGVRLIVEDVFARASFVLNTKVLDPQFQGQVKEKLISKEALKLVSSFVRPQMEFWLNSHIEEGKKLAEMFVKQAQARQHSSQKIEKKKGSSVAVLPGKLTDCTSGDITRNELFLVEGDSAGGSAKKGRDKEYQAVLPLRGKVLNTWEVDRNLLFGNKEVHDISVAIGVDPHAVGEKPDISGLRYGKICIMADADVDGSHIEVLLLTLFYRHFSYLMETGHIFIAMPPLFKIKVAKTAKKKERRIYCLNEEELRQNLERLKKEKYKENQIEISRFKGLGEMDWQELKETSLDPETRRLLPIKVGAPGDELTEKAMNILMAGKEADSRKEWIERHGDQFEPDI
ncbi:DNA topoisomerase IV subunit B [Parasutterella muris]|jgi:Type IIA topoisomerase (DNA gyrase/topo II, topoisomerase IV), B subunit|uniref:DNA topoisomerase 4 subunit B n=3 Tax=Parasutterella TaxID=577310 RepID=A0A6L6YIU4_9BURK|nr:DNA topoisomerase IV subunit B [Parasutterella muris]MVX56669.1 DNA topoisomerase IV subunit B [Parasutterella muris]